ncbi:hypothetical protein EG359_11630 [Chryseobacterium joostei]|nr:hypothetical protein EG359_11630 [Chryseobacterium joostei]
MSCHKKENNTVNFEKKVFDDIFIPTVDSTLIDMRTYIGFQYSEKQRDSIQKDTLNRVVAFNTVNYMPPIDFSTGSTQKYKPANDSIWSFSLEKYNSSKYKFKNVSEQPFTDELTQWQKKYPKFSGSLSFSKIYFDETRKTGVFEVTYFCGSKCGVGYQVHIKKMKNKWKIIKVEHTWIS